MCQRHRATSVGLSVGWNRFHKFLSTVEDVLFNAHESETAVLPELLDVKSFPESDTFSSNEPFTLFNEISADVAPECRDTFLNASTATR